MTAGPLTDRVVTEPVDLDGETWWQIVDGTALVGLPVGPGQRPVDRPAFATLQTGDVIVPAPAAPITVRPVGSLTLLPLPPADRPLHGPAVARWLATLADAAGTAGSDAATSAPRGDRRAGGAEVPAQVQLLVQAIDARTTDTARRRAGRAAARSSATEIDGAALHELSSAVRSLQATRPPAVDVVGELLALLGLPGTASTSDDVDPGRAGAVDTGDDGSVAADRVAVRRRAAAGGHLLRTVELGLTIRTDLLAPVIADLDGRLVALVPGWRGTDIVDPADGTRRRLTRDLIERISETGLSAVVELPHQANLRDLARAAWRGNAADAWLVAGGAAAAAVLSLLVPLAGGAIFGSIVPGEQYRRLAALVGALLAVIAATAVLAVLQGRVMARIRTRVDSSAGDAIWARLLRLPVSFFNRYGSGELLARASVVDTLRQVVTDSIVSSMVAGATVVVSLLLVILQSPLAGLFTLLVVVAQGLGFWWILRRWQPLMQTAVVQQQALADRTLQAMRGIARIRVFAAEDRVMRLLSVRFAALTRTTFEASRCGAGVTTGLAAWPTLGTLAVTAGVVLTGAGDISAGEYVVMTTALGQVLGGTAALLIGASQLVGVQPQLRQLAPILDTEPETCRSTTTRGDGTPVVLQGGVELSGVSFRYREDGPDVLRDVSLAVRPGEFVALVGPSGSGKSTMMRLVLGFEQATAGVVSFDGIPLDRMDPHVARRQLGTVLQNSSLFPGNLADNIRGPRELPMDQVWAAAEAAAVADDIRRMPMGMQTVVVEGAATLSGGQRQRLVIARALAGSPRLLLLDEATSALDNISQSEVAESLERLRITRLVIAHRLSTIRHADRIVVLDAGRVVQQGTYDELIARPGLFLDLAQRQLVDGD